ncbi:YidC/Oxa1 family membrane protein insertase [Amycolatopsis minnesotensis]|uniref:Membrane protein insertase YidC n=1 Tax=Amycolatopsis minnesotensis TaxID=337894 RepID=A0ABP5CHH8_9PSEU
MFGFLDVPAQGAQHAVAWLADLVHPLSGELSTAVAIVASIALIRLALHPLARAAVRGEKKRAALAPQLQKLRDKHKNDPARLQEATLSLYRESGASLFAGCLPMLAQAPFFMVLYRLFSSATLNGTPNAMLAHTVFGVPLGGHFATALTAGPQVLVFAGLLACLGCVAYFTARWQRNRPGAGDVPGARLIGLMPYGTVLIAAVVPLAAGLYLLTTTAWTVTERAFLHRRLVVG